MNSCPALVCVYRAALLGPYVSDWQDRPVSSITRAEIRDKLEVIADKTPILSNRMRAYWGRFFGWCLEQDLIELDPTAGVRALAPETSRDRVLTAEEVTALLSALEKSKIVMAPVFKLLILTGQRRNEISALRWSEVKDLDGDDPRIELSGERTKNHRPHIIPLAPQAVGLLKSLPRFAVAYEGKSAKAGDFVFSASGKTPVSAFSGSKARIDKLMTEAFGQPLPSWTIHDIRRTVATMMNDALGIEPHVVEAVLNHISGAAKAGVAGTYNRAAYLPQRRLALTAWANYLDGLSGKATGENVVTLQRKGG
jgi:integrase